MYGSSRSLPSFSSAGGMLGASAYAVEASSSTGSTDMLSAQAQEQASADLVLLQQNLIKSKVVTSQMTALLTSFDDRLARLDKSVVPIHRSTKDLSKIQRNVEAALFAIDAVVGTNDLVDREQEVIDGLPKHDLPGYMASLTRLKSAMQSLDGTAAAKGSSGGDVGGGGGVVASPLLATVAGLGGLGGEGTGKGKEREGTLGRVKGLIETGCKKVADLFLDLVQEASPRAGWSDVGSWDQGTVVPTLMSEEDQHHLVNLLTFIQSVLGHGSELEKDLHRGYGEIRGMFVATTLNHVGREALDGIEVQTRAGNFAAGRLPAMGRRGFGRFIDAMFAMSKSEHHLAGLIFETHMANHVYRYIVPPALTILTATGTSINTALKKSLTTNATSVGIAFTCFVEMNEPQRVDVFEDWIRSKAGRKDNELAQLSHAFKGSCLRSLPEFLEECRAFGSKAPAGPELTNAGISPITVNVVNFTKQLCEFPDTVDMFLATLGDGNWLPGGPAAGKSMPAANKINLETGGPVLLPKYLSDVIQTLLQALDARARALGSFRHAPGSSSVLKKDKDQYGSGSGGNRQGAMLSAMFMLNNISYVRRELLLNSNVPDLMTSAGGNGSRRDSSSTTVTATNSTTPRDFDIEDELNRRNRQAKTSYLEVFSPLVSCLMDAGVEQSVLKSAIGVGNTEKKDTKDRFVRFNESLEEIENLHHRLPNCKIDKNEDLLLRDRLRDEVVRMCVPTYTAFVKRHENFSKNPSKYLKISPSDLQARLEKLFD